ncbi:hypothetical protein CKO31_22215 [Thiohalocapsa halophila]|uniref:Toxin-antitoxin system HicB family antitoxin n=1 Tax=Thiohalocapsa halophila TaxID=69359 RepID=A0ABS1CN94_9GAMM|nr:type II toxin-antitoxin system HicB family antitoxin [Thiohalocapsa halophila]MBK1633412.1 hypothetical protein [Thiohalocapsa halophila]
MNTMTYRGHVARISYDDRDRVFVGRLLGVPDIVSFHAESVAELRAEMAQAVEDYLADSADDDRKDPSAVEELVVLVAPGTRDHALAAARASGKSLDSWAAEALERAASTGV